ncbi:hypothetical protein Back2_12610 [Nocardioides baekrokdamisoli]|uniref:Uncharacterized protein n=1 Tax=Nocardioides baekrokdamisoli TaxID=1804624 RepID=A0A3G9J0I1_9ACTN|nr:hypothetical protein [Nocardioides baekrokdamisoli]BBH16974.1 hypothetical protein Back2_12610 [Nocardioides baekrokdamisoli]
MIGVGAVSPRVQERAIHWIDGGPLSGWTVVHSRVGRPVGGPGQAARFMLTKVASSVTDPVIQRWVDHLGILVVADDEPVSEQVFCRIVVRQRSIALNAVAFDDVAGAQESVRSITSRAMTLQVAFAFIPGEPIPMWVVHDRSTLLFVGLPQHHLARVSDPRVSLAAMLSAARIKGQVHEAGGEVALAHSGVRPARAIGQIPRARRA